MIPPFTVLGKTFGIYPLIALIGFFTSGIFACIQIKKRNFNEDHMINLFLWSAAGALVGGHILFAITNISLFPQLFAILSHTGLSKEFIEAFLLIFGGSVFYGGLLGGMVTGGLYYRKKQFPNDFVDVMAVSVPLFHTFGRIGCFLGGCCYGIECSMGFTYTQNPIAIANGVRRFPVQLLEALFCFVLFLVLFSLLRRGLCKGRLLAVYLCVYAVGRFFLEFLRGDSYRGFLFGLSTSQIISILLLIGTVVFLLTDQKRRKRPAVS